MNLSELRENYTQGGINKADVSPNPFEQLAAWLQLARDQKIKDSNAMIVGTANKKGVVTSRTLLLKGIVDEKLQFFTNYNSQKARDLAENPHASMTILWKELERQICIHGTVQKTSREISEEYFKTRPYDSKIGAWVSENQSTRIAKRADLESRKMEFEARFPNKDEVPCPGFWGGYELTPSHIEFWQGREGRLHDRLAYHLDVNNWILERLSP